jgi:hypothetical protein
VEGFVNMLIKSFIQAITGQEKISRLADNLAYACSNVVWQKVESRIDTMTHSQARGYVRAKAGRTVRLILSDTLRRKLISPRHQTKVVEMTMDAIVEQTLLRYRGQQPQTLGLQRAA